MDLLAKSVAKVSSKGKKGEKQEETGKPMAHKGLESNKIEDSVNRDPSRKAIIVNLKDKKELKAKQIYQLKEDIIKTVVYNQLEKVSPKLAKEFEYQFTIVKNPLKLESLVDFSYKKIVNLIKEYDNENQFSKDNTFRKEGKMSNVLGM